MIWRYLCLCNYTVQHSNSLQKTKLLICETVAHFEVILYACSISRIWISFGGVYTCTQHFQYVIGYKIVNLFDILWFDHLYSRFNVVFNEFFSVPVLSYNMMLIDLLMIQYKVTNMCFASISPVFVFEKNIVFARGKVDFRRTIKDGYIYFKKKSDIRIYLRNL